MDSSHWLVWIGKWALIARYYSSSIENGDISKLHNFVKCKNNYKRFGTTLKVMHIAERALWLETAGTWGCPAFSFLIADWVFVLHIDKPHMYSINAPNRTREWENSCTKETTLSRKEQTIKEVQKNEFMYIRIAPVAARAVSTTGRHRQVVITQ